MNFVFKTFVPNESFAKYDKINAGSTMATYLPRSTLNKYVFDGLVSNDVVNHVRLEPAATSAATATATSATTMTTPTATTTTTKLLLLLLVLPLLLLHVLRRLCQAW